MAVSNKSPRKPFTSRKRAAKSSGRRVSDVDKGKMRLLFAQGKSKKAIAAMFGVAELTAAHWINRPDNDLAHHDDAKTGRPATFDTTHVRAALRAVADANKHNTFTMAQFRAQALKRRKVGSAVQVALSKMSEAQFRRIFAAAGLKSAATIAKPEGMIFNAVERLKAAKLRLTWPRSSA